MIILKNCLKNSSFAINLDIRHLLSQFSIENTHFFLANINIFIHLFLNVFFFKEIEKNYFLI